MRFIEIPALITEDIEDPNIVDITETETVTASISGTTLTINGDSKVSGETTITLTGDVTVDAIIKENLRQPSIHKIIIKTNGAGNFTYVPNNTVTASSVSTTTKTGSDLEILLITTSGGDTYLDLDVADYVSPALYTSNALTGFDISELTSTYGATAKLYKPDGTLLTTVTSATTGNGVNFGYTESTPGDVTYTLEVEDDLGRTSRYDLPRKWISYAMETNSTPGFEKLELAGNEYTSTTIVPNISPSSKAKVFRTNNHGYMGINFKIQGRNSTNDAWTDIANADEDDEVLAFGDYLYHRVWVKPTAKATTTVSSSNVVTLTLSNLTEENVTTSFTGADPFDINESTNTYVFEETTKIGTFPFTVTLGTETYTNAVTATTEGTAYDYVTLAFANPTLSLTTSNVTISSAKLYRDDVLFHTYGTESNVVLRSDQTGTYQAIVNDVYYSNRITPDFTTTRSVSAPQLVFDGYNRLNLSNSTPTSTTLGLPDGTTRDLTTQSNVYIYETGTYTANVQTSDTFAYLSNVVTSQPSQNSADVGPTFTFDGYNRLNLSNLTQTSSTLKYGSKTYDTNTASNVYVTDTGEYILEAKDANTFVMSNVYVGAVSQHPSDVVPTLTFDGYNKLTIENDGNGDTGMKNVTISGGPWNTLTFKPDDNAQKGKFQWDLWSSTANYQIGNKHNLEYVPGYGWYVLNQDGTGFGDVTPTSATSGTYLDGNGVSQTFSTNLASSSGGVLSIAHTAGTMTVNESDFFEGGIFPPKVGSLESVTIKKDGVAFATTTSDTVYIRDTGTYTAEVKGSGAYAIELSNVVTGSVIPNVVFPSSSNQALVSTDGSVKWPSANDNIDGQTALDASGTTLAIGTIDGNGAIYVFEKTNGVWTQVQKMTANSPASSTFFGGAISISGDIIVTCTYGPNNSDGFVYVFEKTNGVWPSTETVKMDPQYERLTGIDIYGTTIVATERHETNRGRFYIFEKTNGLWPSNYTSRIDTGTGYFTWCSAMYGDNLAIMHVRAGTTYSYVLFYERDVSGQWNYLETKGTSEGQQTGSAGGSFGRVMSMYDTTVAITGLYDDSNKGNVYVYKKSNGTWVFDEKISNHGITNERFGMSLKLISETKLLIGSYGHAYIYEDIGGTWTETFKFEGADNTDFGKYSTLSSDGNTAFISDTSYNSNQGAVYVYEKGPAGPNITYDGKNKLTLNQLNYEDTATVTVPNESTYNLGTAKTIYVKDTGEYVFKISGTDKYIESNVYVSSVDLVGAPTKPIDFDGYNKLTLIDAGSNVSANVTYFSNTYELGSANVLYINGAGTYDLAMSGSNVFALSSNVVGTVSQQHPTDVVPSLTFDNYNKLTLENFTTSESDTRTAKLTDPNGNTYSLGQTQNDIYIEDTGEYILEVTNSDQSAVVKTNVGTVTEEVEVSPQLWWNTYTNSSTVDDSSPNNLDGTLNSVTDTDGAFTFDGSSSYIQMATTGATDSNVQLAMWDISCEFYKTGSGATGDYIDRQAVVLVTKGINAGDGQGYDINYGLVIDSNNKLCTGFEEAGSNQITIESTTTINNNQWYTARATFDGTTLNLYLDDTLEATATPTISPASSDLGPFMVGAGRYDTSRTPAAYFQGRIKNVKVYNDIFISVPQPPSLTFDGYNKLSIENLTPTSTRLTYGSNTYEIGTASNVYIEHEGTYKMATGDATTFALVSKEVGTQPSGTTYNLTSLTRVSNYSTTNTSKAQVSGNGTWPVSSFMATHNVLNNGDKAYGKTDGGSSRDPAQLFDTISSGWGEASHGTNGTHSPMSWGYEFTSGAKMISKMILYQPPNTHPAGNVTIKYWDGTSMTTVSNQSPIGMTSEVALSSTEFTFDAVSSQYWQIDCYRHATQTTGYTGLSEWEIYGNVITTINTPSLTYDTSNKLSIENLTPTSTILTDPNGSSFDIGTALNVYIRDSGTYSIASKDANTFVLTSNTVTGTPTGTTYTHTILTGSHTRISDRDASNTNRTHNSGSSDWPDSNSGITHYQDLSNGDRSYQKTNGGDSRDAAQLFDGVDSGNWGNASHGNVGTHSPMTWGYKFTSGSKQCSQMILVQPPNTHHAGNVTIKYWDGTSMTAVSNQSPLSMDNQTTDNDPTTFTFDAVSSQFWQIDCYRGSDNSTGYTGLHAWEIYDNPYEYVTGTTPSQTYDNTKTITVKNVPSTLTDVAGKIYKGSTAYTIHATTSSSNVIIENAGTYVSVFTTATQAFLTNAIDATEPTTTSDDTTIEDEGFIPGSTAVTTVTTTDAPSVTLDATDTTVTDPTLDLDFTTTLPRTLKRYNNITSSSIGARFNRHETRKKRVEKSISIPTSFSAELTANNASSPTTLTVTVANSKFVINGDETPTLGFIRGETYTFDQSDASNSGHPLVLATSEDGATQYTTGWTTTPSSPDYVPGVSGAQGTFIVPYDVPDTIYYKCNVHPNMGGEINTTFGNVFSLGDFTVAANTHVSGEYTLATNYDGTTSNLYVNGELITQTTPSPPISAGVKEFILGKEFDGYVKNFKFWNYAKRFRPPGIYPQTLPSIDSSGIWHNSTEYRWRSSEPGYEIYGRWRIDFSPEAFDAENENIRVNTTTNIWEDSGTANPTGVTDGSTVTLTIDNGASVLYKFTKPTDASWID